MTRLTIVAVALAAAGCAERVDPPPLGDYTSWARIEVRGEAPGHGDSLRVIYANDVAIETATSRYLPGAILVKEIYRGDTATPDALDYVAIMRRCTTPDPYADDTPCTGNLAGLDGQGGWLFTTADAPGGAESTTARCWNTCHAAAPFEGAFYDYRALAP